MYPSFAMLNWPTAVMRPRMLNRFMSRSPGSMFDFVIEDQAGVASARGGAGHDAAVRVASWRGPDQNDAAPVVGPDDGIGRRLTTALEVVGGACIVAVAVPLSREKHLPF